MHLVCYYPYYSCLCTFWPYHPYTYFFNLFSYTCTIIILPGILLQLKQESDSLKKIIRDLRRNKEELLKLKKELCEIWKRMGLMLEEAAYKRNREREKQKMVMNELQSI